MIRSGSTLQYQLANEILAKAGPVQKLGFIFPDKQVPAESSQGAPGSCKLHHWDEKLGAKLIAHEAIGLYCFRDLRDVAVSAMRKFNISFEELWEKRWLHTAVRDGERWLDMPNVYSAKYELLVNELVAETSRIAAWIGLRLETRTIAAIATDHSFDAQKRRFGLAKPDSTLGYDAESLLHSNHLHEGAVDGWRKILSDEQAKLIWGEFKEWFELRGYTDGTDQTPASAATPATASVSPDGVFVPHLNWFSHGQNDEVARLLREGHYEADLQAFFFLYLRNGDRVMDVGAHFGLYSRLARSIAGTDGQVLAVEPHPVTQMFLADNLKGLKPDALIKAALGRQPGKAELVVGNAGYSAHSFLADKTSEQTTTVEVKTLQQVVSAAKWTSASLVKIDTEGREFDVLEGAGPLLGTSALPVITLEFAEKNLLQFGRTTRQLARYLQQNGYQVCRLSLTTLQLECISDNIWPVWYENFIAVLDLDSVNQRLASASLEHQRIARDILARAAACQPIKEISELETYRHQASLSQQHKSWAEQTEQLLTAERILSAELKQWAEKNEFEVAAEKVRSRSLEEWASNSEQLLAQEKKRSAAFEEWAQRVEAELKKAEALIKGHEAWAINSDRLLALEKERAAEFERWAIKIEAEFEKAKALASSNEAWALKNEAALQEAVTAAAGHKAWALKNEAALQEAITVADGHREWAEKTERLLAASRQECADNKAWAERTEQFLAEARAAMRQFPSNQC